MAESTVVKLRRIYPKLKQVKRISKKWSISTARELSEEIKILIPLLKTKKQLPIKKSFKHCVATLDGVIKGREEKILEIEEVKQHLKKLIPVVKNLQEQIQDLDILDDVDEDCTPVKKKTLTIRPGYDEVSTEAQDRIQDSITDENGVLRKSTESEEELSSNEKIWEEAEYYRITRDQQLTDWNTNFYGEMTDAFSRYFPQIEKLQRVIKNQAILQVAPVVPFAKVDSLFRVGSLKRAGVSVVYVSGCPVFEDQIILSVNINELSDEQTEVDAYRYKYREYKKKIEKYAKIFYPVSKLETYKKWCLNELDFYVKEPASSSVMGDKDRISAARDSRTAWLNKEIEKTDAAIAKLELGLTKERAEFLELDTEFKAYTKNERSILRGKLGGLSPRILELAEKCMVKINSRLGDEDKITIVSPSSFIHGRVACFWVMKDSQLSAWSNAISSSKIQLSILGWCFPTKSKTSTEKTLENRVAEHNALIKVIHDSVLKEDSAKRTEKKAIEYLTSIRKTYDAYYKEVVSKIIKEAPGVILEREIMETGGFKVNCKLSDIITPDIQKSFGIQIVDPVKKVNPLLALKKRIARSK